jgi:ribosomal protein S6
MARKEKETPEGAEETLDADHAESRVYELGFHIDAELASEEVKKVYETMRSLIAKTGSIVAEGTPTKIQLAYTISRNDVAGRRDFDTAHFAWIAYEANGEGHEAVLEAAKEEIRIIRFLDVRTEKEAALHAAEMAEIAAKMAPAEGVDDGEAVSDAELSAALEGAAA